jgi:hypothetical protein
MPHCVGTDDWDPVIGFRKFLRNPQLAPGWIGFPVLDYLLFQVLGYASWLKARPAFKLFQACITLANKTRFPVIEGSSPYMCFTTGLVYFARRFPRLKQ